MIILLWICFIIVCYLVLGAGICAILYYLEKGTPISGDMIILCVGFWPLLVLSLIGDAANWAIEKIGESL